MSLYPVFKKNPPVRLPGGSETWVEEVNRFDGVLRYRRVYAGPWVEGERTNCYCCSCGDYSDPFCRNHGFAGARPCEVHEMPGAPGDDGVMPASVQARLRSER